MLQVLLTHLELNELPSISYNVIRPLVYHMYQHPFSRLQTSAESPVCNAKACFSQLRNGFQDFLMHNMENYLETFSETYSAKNKKFPITVSASFLSIDKRQ